MNRIISYLQQISKPINKKIMGRWKITYSTNVLNTKIDLANSDNCYTSYKTNNLSKDDDDKIDIDYVLITSY